MDLVDAVFLLGTGLLFMMAVVAAAGLIAVFVILVFVLKPQHKRLYAFMAGNNIDWYSADQLSQATQLPQLHVTSFLGACIVERSVSYRVQLNLLSQLTMQQVDEIERDPLQRDHVKQLEYQLVRLDGPPKWYNVVAVFTLTSEELAETS